MLQDLSTFTDGDMKGFRELSTAFGHAHIPITQTSLNAFGPKDDISEEDREVWDYVSSKWQHRDIRLRRHMLPSDYGAEDDDVFSTDDQLANNITTPPVPARIGQLTTRDRLNHITLNHNDVIAEDYVFEASSDLSQHGEQPITSSTSELEGVTIFIPADEYFNGRHRVTQMLDQQNLSTWNRP